MLIPDFDPFCSLDVFKRMSNLDFDHVLCRIIDIYFDKSIEVLRETTWVFLILFSREINLRQGVIDSGVLFQYERLLKVEDPEVIENVY